MVQGATARRRRGRSAARRAARPGAPQAARMQRVAGVDRGSAVAATRRRARPACRGGASGHRRSGAAATRRRARRRRAGRRRRSPPPRRPRGAGESMPGVPRGNAASRTSMRTVRARSGVGQRHGAVGRHGQRRRRPAVGDHAHARSGSAPRTGARSSRSVRIVRGAARAPLKPRAARADPAGDPRSPLVAVEGRRGAVAPEALEARGAVEAPSGAPPAAVQRSSTWSGVSGATLTHASARHARARAGRDRARPAALAVLLVAHQAARASRR